MAKISDQQYIIAIGASAGGLDAIAAFFDHTPLDGVSYIVIQHLAADFKSQMAGILSRHTKLQVVEVTEDILIESNKVYLIPSSNFMAIKAGKLLLSAKTNEPRPYMTINHFFISLAKERGDKAIGIVFSGTGKDGTKGIEAIKANAGMVIIQDPKTATFKEMPFSAIDTGCADFILSPEAMPQVIEDFVKNNDIDLLIHRKPGELSDVELAGIINLIKGNMPLDFTEYKRPTILRRIKRRMAQHNFTRVDKYYNFLKNNPKEIELLANDFLISVTSFFRDAEAFEIIEQTVIPGILGSKVQGDILKIWVAGCATGEEAYSLAILVKEHLLKTGKKINVKIFATDLNKAALDIGSMGIYTQQIEKAVSKERLEQFFTRDENLGYKIKHEIRQMLIFAQHDLVKNPPYCNMDLISCRNLLIYLNGVLQKKVFGMMHFGLKKDGYLFLGPSENSGLLQEDFKEISHKWNILQSKKIGRGIRFDPFSSPVIEEMKTIVMEVSRATPIVVSKMASADEINLAIIKDAGVDGVCTDQYLTVVRSFGNPSAFLKKEIFNFNLSELLPDNISVIFKAAVHQAVVVNKRVIIKGLQFTDHLGKAIMVDIAINPVTLKNDEVYLVVFFSGSKNKAKQALTIRDTDIDQLTRGHLIALEKELLETKHSLQVAYDRIASSNENMQSFNEELQSANEEMQSANEEMQSTNEELQTINKEHQLTIDELTDLNDDLNNYFRSNTNGQLFVDQEILVKRYSPGIVKHINIRDSDIGRPLNNLTTNIKFETLIEDIKKVIYEEQTIIREAEALDGKIYQVMTMPYLKKNSKKAEGAVISFYDITELKKLLEDLDISNKTLSDSVTAIGLSREKVSVLLAKEKELNALKSRFVSMASHEFKTPITSIQLAAEIIEKIAQQTDYPIVKRCAETISGAAKNLTNILNDFLSLELLETGKIDPIMSDFDVVHFCKEISEEIKFIAKPNQQIAYQHTGKNRTVTLNPSLLKNCVINLISNAIKYSGDGAMIEFYTKITKRSFELVIKDNGIGIPINDQKYLFEAFFRAHNTGKVPGTGLGLNIVNRYTSLMHGAIEFKSKVNVGTTFTLTFPFKVSNVSLIPTKAYPVS